MRPYADVFQRSLPLLTPPERAAPLPNAAFDGDLRQVAARLDAGDDPNTPDSDGGTALLWAAHWGDEKMVRRLLDAGADPSRANDNGHTPLLASVRQGAAPITRRLLDAGASRQVALRFPRPKRPTPAQEARRQEREETGRAWIAEMLEHEAREKKRRESAPSPEALAEVRAQAARSESLHAITAAHKEDDVFVVTWLLVEAIKVGCVDTLRLLLNAGESPNLPPPGYDARPSDLSLLGLAIARGADEMAQALLAAGAEPDGDALCLAVQTGDTDCVRGLLKAGADRHVRGAFGTDAVTLALLAEDTAMCAVLLQAGAPLPPKPTRDTLNDDGAMDTHRAWQKLESSPALLAVVREQLGTAWLDAIPSGDRDRIRQALETGANPNVVRDDDETALLLAVQNGNADVALTLLQHGANPNQADRYGRTPLILASQQGSLPLVSLLLRFGADRNQASKWGYKPLFTACVREHRAVADLLEKAGAQASPCDLVLRGDHARLVRLWDAGIPLDAPSAAGMTALMGAALRGNRDLTRELLNRGASINAQDNAGHTALYFAATHGHLDLTDDLLAGGADPDLRGKREHTVLYAALLGQQMTIAALLVQYGATIGNEGMMGQHLMHIALEHDAFTSDGAPVGNAPRLRLLLALGGDPNAVSHQGESLLYEALRQDHRRATIHLLLKRGADINRPNDDGLTPLDLARIARPELIGFLEKRGARIGNASEWAHRTLEGWAGNDLLLRRFEKARARLHAAVRAKTNPPR